MSSYGPVTEGSHFATCTKAEWTKARTGKSMLKVTMKIDDGGYADDGKLVWDNLVINPGSEWGMNLFFNKLAGFGISKTDFEDVSKAEIAEMIEGRVANFFTGIREYQGREYTDVKSYFGTANINA